MFSWPVLRELPRGFRVLASPRACLAAHETVSDRLAAAGFGPDEDGALRSSDLAGRKPLFELSLDGERFVVRRYSHGGLLRWLTRARFLDPERPFRELALSRRIAELGFSTPDVVAARARRASVGGWQLDVISRRVESSCDLGTVLALAHQGRLSFRARRDISRAVGTLVRRMHDSGFLHADLTPRNLLVQRAALDGEEPHLVILDLGGSRLGPALSRGERVDNLRRLDRHVERLTREGDARLHRSDRMRVLAAYENHSAARRELWRAIEARRAQLAAWHLAGWALERRFGARGRSATPAQ